MEGFMRNKSLFALTVLITLFASRFAGQEPKPNTLDKATFAGGCFWCMEQPFESLDGVISVTSGYSGGFKKNPTYEEVSAGETGHAEAVQMVYDATRMSYAKLLEVFWHNIDPLAANKQFCDRGTQYRSAIFYHNKTQQQLAEESKRKLEEQPRFKGKIATEICAIGASALGGVGLKEFYPAEEYHQDFYKKNPFRYKSYKLGCGRDRRLKELWGEDKGERQQ
jgi:peptide-methionine (S)-S-oxide reductase